VILAASTNVVAQALLAIAAVVLVGRVAGSICQRIGQPRVIGEIIAGIALGPSLLGLFGDGLTDRLFPDEVIPSLKVLAEFGLVLFMFIVGLEVDLGTLGSNRRRALAISLTSIATPFVLATLVLAPFLYDDHDIVDGAAVRYTPFALILGVCMCGTAFAILARILSERRMFKIPLGMTLMASAAVDDIVSFTLLGFTTAVAGSSNLSEIPITLASAGAFIAVLFFVGRPILRKAVLEPYQRNGLTPDVIAVLFAGVLLSAWVTTEIGLNSLIGAFLFGALLPRDPNGDLLEAVVGKVEGVSTGLLLPVFFVTTGLNVDVGGLEASSLVSLAAIVAVASIGKFAGGAIAARLSGISTRQSMAVGVLMNTRGLSELVILNIGRDLGLIDDQLFTMLVLMALITTVSSGPLLRLVYPDRWLARDIAEAERAAADATDRVVAVVDDPGAAGGVAALAAGLTESGGEVVLVHPHAPMSAIGMVEVLDGLQSLGGSVSDPRLRVSVRTAALDDPGDAAAVAAVVAALGPSAVVLSRARAAVADALAGSVDVASYDGTDAPAVVGLDAASGRNGAAALEVAARIALHGDWPVAVSGEGRAATQARRALQSVGVATHASANGVARIGEWSSGADIEVLSAIGERPSLLARFGDGGKRRVERIAER
jgi:Kef-type K+ transport system membrane component KefB